MTEVVCIGDDNQPAPKILEPYLQSGNLNFLIGSGGSFPAIKTAGNIEAEINDLLAANKEDEANKKCFEFIRTISNTNSRLLSIGFDANVTKVKKRYIKFLSTVDRILFTRKNILLARQANIFTTNYDLFLEHAASAIPGIVLNDGFDRSSLMKPAMFAPERYFDRTYRSGTFYRHQIEIPTINLIKLHGSLSWRQHSNSVVFDPTPVPMLTAAEQSNSTKINEFLTKHFLILPNLRKFHATLMERVYYDLLRLFSRSLDQQNVVLLVFGFSFSDEHILDLTRRALRNPTSHLIVFAYNQSSADDYKTKFAEQRNVTVICPDPATVIDFPRLNEILASILPVNVDAIA
jgi:hypothetical protein